jgi:hypothetical protein
MRRSPTLTDSSFSLQQAPIMVRHAVRTSLVCLALLALGGQLLAGGVELTDLLPAEGTVGTPLELQLSGDLGKGKPKVWFTLADDPSQKPKKTKVKVTTVTDLGGGVSSLAMSFKRTKTGPGAYDLHVRPKGKGKQEQIFPKAFTVRGPDLSGSATVTAASKGQALFAGEFLGSPAKPRVFLFAGLSGKGKKAKVLSATGGALMLKLPKLAPGTYNVVVVNKVGNDILPGGLVIDGDLPPRPNCPDTLTVALASDGQPLLLTNFMADSCPPLDSVLQAFSQPSPLGQLTIITAADVASFEDSTGFTFGFVFDPGTTPTPFTLDVGSAPPGFTIQVVQTGPDATWNDFAGATGSITVTSATNQRITGSFELTLPPGGSNPAAAPLEMTGGQFTVRVQ